MCGPSFFVHSTGGLLLLLLLLDLGGLTLDLTGTGERTVDLALQAHGHGIWKG